MKKMQTTNSHSKAGWRRMAMIQLGLVIYVIVSMELLLDLTKHVSFFHISSLNRSRSIPLRLANFSIFRYCFVSIQRIALLSSKLVCF